jgi:hypothetical protein
MALAMAAGAILSGAQAVLGAAQTFAGAGKMNRLLSQRKAYTTPEEYFKILNATKSMASQGYDAFTLNYLTNQTDRAFSSSVDAAKRLGADPNDLSALFDNKITAMMQIGAENHSLNLQNFSKYLEALNLIGESKTAEWKSQQDIIKDKIQAAAGNKNQGVQNIGNAANLFLSTLLGEEMKDLYRPKVTTNNTTMQGAGTAAGRTATG